MSNEKKKIIDITQRTSLLLTIVDLCNDSKKFEHHLEDIVIKNKKYPRFLDGRNIKTDRPKAGLKNAYRFKTDGLLSGSNTTNWALTKRDIIL